MFEISDKVEVILGTAWAESAGELDTGSVTALDELDAAGDAILLEVAAYRKGLRAEADSIASVIQGLEVRRSRLMRLANALDGYILDRHPRTKLKDGRVVCRVQAKPPSVVVDDAEALPADCWRVVPESREPDKVEIKARIKAGAEVPGARLEQGERLVIE